MRRLAAIAGVALLFCLAPPAEADTALSGDLDVSSWAVEGPAAASGVLHVLHTPPRLDEKPIVGNLSFSADRLRATEVHGEVEADVEGVGATPAQYSTQTTEFHDAQAEVVRRGANYYLFLSKNGNGPAPGVSLDLPGMELEPSTSDAVQEMVFVQGDRDPIEVDVRKSHHPASAGSEAAGRLRVTGDFTLVVWDWDLRVHGAQQSRTFQSGVEERDPDFPANQVPGATERHTKKLYFEVTNGTLTFDIERPQDVTLHASLQRVVASGLHSFEDPVGTLQAGAQEQQVLGRMLRMDGTLDLALEAPESARIPVEIQGNSQSLALDGEPLALGTATGGMIGPGWALPVLLAGLAATGSAGAWYRTRRVRAARMNLLEEAMDEARYGYVVTHAPRLVPTRRHGPNAAVMLTVSHLRRGELAEAQRVLDRRDCWRGEHSAMQDFLAAHVAAKTGRTQEAARKVRQCLQKAPDLASEVMQNPVLSGLLEHESPREGYS